MPRLRDLRRKLKDVDKAMRRHHQSSDFAYDIVCNDRGAAVRRWQAKLDKMQDRRDILVEQIKEQERV